MFIKVRYGDDEVILCNPQCSVNNLLDSITTRCGLKNAGRTLDLSDETGLVLRLNDHREEYADMFLSKYSTYILVEKQEIPCSIKDEGYPVTGYVPLLKNLSSLLPKFKLRVSMETASKNLQRHPKSPRPAGKSASHGHGANKLTPNKKTKRSKTKTPKDAR